MSRPIIFMHLPKCGGTTFHNILERIYDENDIFSIRVIDNVKLNTENFINLSQEERDQKKLLKGFAKFGMHQYFTEKADYITFVRNPVERIISYYHFVQRSPNHRLHKSGDFTPNMSLYDFVTQIDEGDIHNGQIRFVSGVHSTEDEMLEKALRNIDEHFPIVGELERFDESLIMMQKKFGWPSPYYELKNKTENRPQQSAFDEKTINAIKERNTGDIILYEKMSKRLDAQLTQEFDNLPEELENFKKVCAYYNKSKVIPQSIRSLMPKALKDVLAKLIR